jgi:hypothetical protein
MPNLLLRRRKDVSPHNSIYQSHPSVIKYCFETNRVRVLSTAIPRRQQPPLLPRQDSDSEYISPAVVQEKRPICEPLHDWQTHTYPMCNKMHEFDVMLEILEGEFELRGCGGSRCAFKIITADGGAPLAFKTQVVYKEIDEHRLELSRIDGLTMERLTLSPYVVSTYGYCGLSQISEYGGEGSLWDLVERMRWKEEGFDIPSLDKLRIAIQIVTAVADLHGFEEDGVASVTHNDLNPDQFVMIDGMYKLMDFELSSFVERNWQTQEICHRSMGVNDVLRKVHAPEETYYEEPVDNEKADDYVAGNVVFYVLTKRWIFEGIGNEKAIQKLQKGERPPFPKSIRHSTDPADQAMMKGIKMLWTHDVDKRPKAREVSDFLIKELETVVGHRGDGEVRVSIPPLPGSWDFMEDGDSWEENLLDRVPTSRWNKVKEDYEEDSDES